MDLTIMREFLKDKLAKYKIPSLLKIVQELPKNVMGKVNKKELVKIFDHNIWYLCNLEKCMLYILDKEINNIVLLLNYPKINLDTKNSVDKEDKSV